jgi:branched-chain amino acid transport system permease protein
MISQIITNSVIAGSIYSLIAFGFTLIYGAMRFFNMSYGVTFMVGAYFFYLLSTLLKIPFPIALGLSMACTSFLMIIIDRFSFSRLRQINAPSWSIIMVSIGVAIILEALITTIFGSDVRMVRTGIQQSYTFAGATITPNQLSILYVSILLMFVIWLFLKKTKMGKAIRATANDPHMATVIGIDTEKVFKVVITIGSCLACVAGVLISLESDIEPSMGQPALLKAIVASIIGGIGNIRGAMWGGFLLGFVENFGIWKISAGWKDGIALALLLFFILLKPSLFGLEEER